MTAKINAYFAVLIITLAGSGAALLIVRVATADTFAITGYALPYGPALDRF